MKKKIFVLLFAGLLLLSAAACKSGNGGDATGTDTGSNYNPFPEQTRVVEGTDTKGEKVTYYEPVTQAPQPEKNSSEPNAVFTAVNKKITVLAGVATVRNNTIINDETGIGWPKMYTEFTANGESQKWYRITYSGKDAYIAKDCVCDSSVLQGFTDCDDTVEVKVDMLNVRSVPSTDSSLSIRGNLLKGQKVSRVGKSDKWSIICFEEEEKDSSGNTVKVVKHYYVSNDCIGAPTAATEASTAVAQG